MFVLDASVAASWAFQAGSEGIAASAGRSLLRNQAALAPSIFPYEVANAIWVAIRHGGISRADGQLFLNEILAFPIHLETTPSASIYQNILHLALESELSVYDATYLELALREGIPLATLDTKLQSAAKKLGIRLLGK